MRFYSYLFLIIFLGGKICSFCGKSIVDKLFNASLKKKKKGSVNHSQYDNLCFVYEASLYRYILI